MTYEYHCRATGETREIQASMAEAPTAQFEEDGKTWDRVFRAPGALVRHGSGGVHHRDQTIPVSMSLPLDQREGKASSYFGTPVREHQDGTMSTLRGDRIVRNAEDMKRHCAQSGNIHEPS